MPYLRHHSSCYSGVQLGDAGVGLLQLVVQCQQLCLEPLCVACDACAIVLILYQSQCGVLDGESGCNHDWPRIQLQFVDACLLSDVMTPGAAEGCGGASWWTIAGTGTNQRLCVSTTMYYYRPFDAFANCRALGAQVCRQSRLPRHIAWRPSQSYVRLLQKCSRFAPLPRQRTRPPRASTATTTLCRPPTGHGTARDEYAIAMLLMRVRNYNTCTPSNDAVGTLQTTVNYYRCCSALRAVPWRDSLDCPYRVTDGGRGRVLASSRLFALCPDGLVD